MLILDLLTLWQQSPVSSSQISLRSKLNIFVMFEFDSFCVSAVSDFLICHNENISRSVTEVALFPLFHQMPALSKQKHIIRVLQKCVLL